MSQNRDITFDMMKGIGIILVIIGHLAHGFGWLVPAIYTFHMPLFFILSGYFYKEKKITELLHRDFRSLLVPYLLVTATTIIYGILVEHGNTPQKRHGIGLILFYMRESITVV